MCRYNEEDTKLHLITPALARAGWTELHVTMGYPITAGHILLRGEGHRQLPPKKADYPALRRVLSDCRGGDLGRGTLHRCGTSAGQELRRDFESCNPTV